MSDRQDLTITTITTLSGGNEALSKLLFSIADDMGADNRECLYLVFQR